MNKHKLHSSEQGLVAIIVTMLIMLILSLIVLGFAQLTRREQRQSLDRQLGTQAFYAAETGVNDARNALVNNAALRDGEYIDDCDSFKTAASLTGELDGTNVSYSCLLVDPSPTSLEGEVRQNESQIFPIHRKDGGVINSITISWEDSEGGDSTGCTYPTFRDLPQSWRCTNDATKSNPTGILRVEFVPFAGGEGRASLIDNRFVGFMQPNFSGGASDALFSNGTGDNQGNIFNIRCNVVSGKSNDCVVNLSGLNTTTGYLRLSAYYRPASVNICSPNCTSAVELTGAQAQIDVTGKSVDVLRRIQVRVPLNAFGDSPEFAVQSFDTFCKRTAVAPPDVALLISPGGYNSTGEEAACTPN